VKLLLDVVGIGRACCAADTARHLFEAG
jgi:hypothetical protein